MKTLRIFFICSIAMLLVSCTSVLPPLISWAHFSPPVAQSFKIDTNTAVVYGRFVTGPNFAFGNELALRLRNDNSKQEYLIQFKDKDSVYGISVEPGQYRVAGFVATFVDRRTVGRRTFLNTVPFEVRSNSATYFGDFIGYVKINGLNQEWSVTKVTNNFSGTTDEFRHKYPNLASTSVVSVFGQQSK
ncbi:MAG TPA: hypothetical protein VE344_02550 [Methylomirabilota bacterium]|nr:hypothetical protein [Methylomirabilota bacterium]